MYSLFLGLFQPILAWNEAIMVFYKSLNFFAFFFLNFLFHVGLERNGTITFIFSLSQTFPSYFDLKGSHILIFWIFLLLFWNFQLRFEKERNVMVIFIFSHSHPFPTYFGLKWGHNGISLLFVFFSYFFGIFYLASGRNERER